MNIKKYLREQAEKDAEKLLTEADRIFCRRLAEEIVANHAKEMNEKKSKSKRKSKKDKS